MDGVSQTDQENNGGINTALYTRPVDAVEEFNVQQNAYDSEIGFGGNTVINVVTKSGTNQFHGSLYEFLQNKRSECQQLVQQSEQNRHRTFKTQPVRAVPSAARFAATKLFFFVDYQGTISRSGGTARAGVPSAAERQGDFGELCAAPAAHSMLPVSVQKPRDNSGIQ